jgi:hypothetical protein
MLGDKRVAGIAESTTQFIIEHLFEDDVFAPVGSGGAWHHHTSKPMFDQLPTESCSAVELFETAHQATSSLEYNRLARQTAAWFTGRNLHGESLIDAHTGGCYNSLKAGGIDRDQGAAATIAYLLSEAVIKSAQPISELSAEYFIPIGS